MIDMNGIMIKTITTAAVVLTMVGGGCSSDKSKGEDTVSAKKTAKLSSSSSSSSEGGMPVVKTMKLTEREITHDMVSNGKIMARETADLYFRSSEPVSELWVREGQRVKRGQKLARLDLFKLESERARLLSEREKSILDMQDVLIGQGYDPADKASVPEEVLRLARVRSGLDGIETSIALNKKEIEQSTLTAPFDGVVADLKVKRFGIAPTSEPACRIINDGGMQVEFTVLESELPLLHIGDGVEVSPFAGGNSCRGKVTEINPKVDEKGLVKARASLGSCGGMIDGMNARVRVSKNLGKRLVVPKSAVVLRSGREVVFTLEEGKAMWNYVTTGIENLDSREILEGLTAGQTVITDGNENLAHQTPVIRH